MQDLNDLYFYVQVVDNGGFAAASRALGIPKSKLSRRLQELEERLGVRLLQRSTRKLAVTEIGQEYYRHCVAMLVEAGAAQEAIERSRSGPQGLTRAVSSYGDRRDAFVVRVRLDEADMRRKVPGFQPTPGMPADVFIRTGERTFFEYLMKPVSDSFARAFREH
jgi:multidrug efflux pump subunit AcrA (membrane-fusion protein)